MNDSARDRIFPFQLKKPDGKVALVVGGAGFVGSYICEQLINQEFSVVCVDNLTSGSRENIKNLIDNEAFTYIKADVNLPSFHLPQELKIDLIFHVAGLEEFSIEKELSLETLLVNSLGTRVLLELARAKKAKFVFVSSANLYSAVFSSTSLKYYFGRDAANESNFTHNEAKRFAEALVFEYFKNYDLYAIVTRVKDVYGPRMSIGAEGELNKIISGATTGKKTIISGDGIKTVNPTYVTDVSSGIVKASIYGSKGEIYNLVNPEKVTLDAFIQTTRQVVGALDVDYKKALEDLEPPYHQLDLSTSYEKLSWNPTVSLADGISRTINYFRQQDKGTQNKLPQPIFTEVQNKNSRKFLNLKLPFLSHIRLVIFLAALALVTLTVIYPGGALIFNTYQANSNFKSALKNLESDRANRASMEAEKAEESFRKAANNLQNVEWLLKIIISRERLNALDDFYFVGEKFSAAVYHTAGALDVLITQTSTGANLNGEEVKISLQDIMISAGEARSNYELGAASLESLQNGGLPKALKDDLEVFNEADNTLESLLEELLASTDT